MADRVFKLEGRKTPVSQEEREKLIKNIEASRRQTKEDSKVDLKVLKNEFNI